MNFKPKFSKGHNSIKTVDGVTILFLMVVYIFTKFHENILQGIKATERTQFS